jgi:Na+/H+ antiporter NhaD/arsenite permease-like protein
VESISNSSGGKVDPTLLSPMNVPFDEKPVILAIFVLTYLGLAVGKIPGLGLNRTGIALLGAIGMKIFSKDSTSETASSINWPTIILLFGFFVISAQLRLSGFYDRLATNISDRLNAPTRFLAYLIIATAVLSAFLNNDVICCVLTPVVGAALVRRRIDPLPFLVALAAASNIGAGATLIGNAQNMMIGSVANLSFSRYMLWSAVPVSIALVAVFGVTQIARNGSPPILATTPVEMEPVTYPFDVYHTWKGLVILAIVIALFFTSIPREITVLVAAGIHLLSTKYKTEQLLALVDWPILLLFMALFVVSGIFQATGYSADLVSWMEKIGFDPARPANEALLTAGMTAFISNAPTVMLLMKIVPLVHTSNAYIMAVGNSFAGNAVVTASVANIIVVQEARQQGITISFLQFARIGIPITLLSLIGMVAWAMLIGS